MSHSEFPVDLATSEATPDLNTPASQRLAAFLVAFNTGDQDTIARFMSEGYAPSALQDQTPAERALWDASLFRDTGGLQLIHVETGENEILAHARTNLCGDWFRIRISVEPEPPHRITAITTRPGGRPLALGAHSPLSDEEISDRLNELLGKLTQADMFSGALMVTRGDALVFQHACGLGSQSYNIPNQLDTRFNIGSLAKCFTAVAIGQLAGQGLLSFDDPIARYLPDYPRDVAERVTIHHLLTHTSGLGNFWNEKFETHRAKLRAIADFIPLFIDDPLAFEPGGKWSYSNAGYILLGAIIEAVSSQDYFEYVRQRIFSPAGMLDTDSYEIDRPQPHLAIGYTFNGLNDRPDFGPRRNNLFMHVVKGNSAGGAFSTVKDLHRFSQALLGNRMLSPELTSLMLRGKVAMGGSDDRQYAYGFMLNLVDGKRIIGHSGTFPGIGARLDMYLDHGYTVAILSNYDPYMTQALGSRLREWIAGY